MYDISSLCCTHRAETAQSLHPSLQGVNGSWGHGFGVNPIRCRGGTTTCPCARTSWAMWDLKRANRHLCCRKTSEQVWHQQLHSPCTGAHEGDKQGFRAPWKWFFSYQTSANVTKATLSHLQVMEQGSAVSPPRQALPGLFYFPTTGATGNCTGHSRCSSCESVAG